MADICSNEHNLDAKQTKEKVTNKAQKSAALEVEETNKTAEINGNVMNNCVTEKKEYGENNERDKIGISKGNNLLKIPKLKMSNPKDKCQHYLKQFSPNRYIMEKQIREKFKNMKISSRKKLKLSKRAKKEMCISEADESKEEETYTMKKENTEKENETTVLNRVEKEIIKEEKQEEKKEQQQKEVKNKDMRQQQIEVVRNEERTQRQESNDNVKNYHSGEADEKKNKKEYPEGCEQDQKTDTVSQHGMNKVKNEEDGENSNIEEMKKERKNKKEYPEGCEQDQKTETVSRHEINIRAKNEEDGENSNIEEIKKEKKNIKVYHRDSEQATVPKSSVGSKMLLMKKYFDELHIYTKHETETAEGDTFDVDYKGEELESTRGISQINELRTSTRDFMKQKAIDNERLKYVFSILDMGIQKIETIKAMYRCYKENFNKSMREKMEKINSFIFYSNCNNFRSNFTVECLQNKYKLTNMKEERLGRLFLYIEDINKIKQALKIQQKDKHKTEGIDNASEKNESFYDANENIEDFFIFDDSISCCLGSEDIDSVLANSEYKTVSFLQDDDRFDDFFEEWMKDHSERRETDSGNVDKRGNNNDGKGNKQHGEGEIENEHSFEGDNDVKDEENDTNHQNSAFNRFPKFSFKKYYCFDLNKNLCYIYSYTPNILKKLAEMLHSHNAVKDDGSVNDSKTLDVSDKNNLNFDIDCQNEKRLHYYHRHAVDGGHNLDTYIQFHCEKWQENMYDHVEVKSVDVEFNLDCLKCNIMQLF